MRDSENNCVISYEKHKPFVHGTGDELNGGCDQDKTCKSELAAAVVGRNWYIERIANKESPCHKVQYGVNDG